MARGVPAGSQPHNPFCFCVWTTCDPVPVIITCSVGPTVRSRFQSFNRWYTFQPVRDKARSFGYNDRNCWGEAVDDGI